MRLAPFAALSCALLACDRGPPAEGARERTGDRSTSALAPACEGQPAWTSIAKCRSGDVVYTTTKQHAFPRQLSWRTGTGRGYSPLIEGRTGTFEIKSVETLDTFRCGTDELALLRAPADIVAPNASPLPACDEKLIASRSTPKAGCPEWVNRAAWIEGDRFFGVGGAKLDEAHKPHAISRAAKDAAAEIESMLATTITMQPDGRGWGAGGRQRVDVKPTEGVAPMIQIDPNFKYKDNFKIVTGLDNQPPAPYVEIDRQVGECDGFMLVELSAKAR
jgi:hypothetical protein